MGCDKLWGSAWAALSLCWFMPAVLGVVHKLLTVTWPWPCWAVSEESASSFQPNGFSVWPRQTDWARQICGFTLSEPCHKPQKSAYGRQDIEGPSSVMLQRKKQITLCKANLFFFFLTSGSQSQQQNKQLKTAQAHSDLWALLCSDV